MYLVAHSERAQDAIFGFLEGGALRLAFQIHEHMGALRGLRQKYRDRPMSLADACIVRMAEIYEHHAVLTLDSDFLVYRKNGREPLLLVYPGMGRE
jgi:predicted nucleic acid-binding protein